ncbi:MAG: 2,3-bisphosphoglycerate-independent phosphoglycerate mutase [Saprospiraceae bacterium]|nr:2,3-bisphosphoglycerate-independent phosphoglycerate mutase [Saprospiraceae bacterium]
MKKQVKAALIILDGWGLGKNPTADAIMQANTPFVDDLYKKFAHSELVTHGSQVGLPEGQMGNSEVGHLNIGAGRIVYQELARINQACQDGSLASNSVLQELISQASKSNKTVHLMGLLSDGGVHSHIDHLKYLVETIESGGVKNCFIHAFLDGRDTDPQGGLGYVQDMNRFLADKRTEIASVIGRYYAMDRDKRWERIKVAYDLLVKGEGRKVRSLTKAIEDSYAENVTDEFLLPLVQEDEHGEALAQVQDGDYLICFNFRTDRPRQISKVLSQADMPEFDMRKLDLYYLTMTRYDETFQGIKVMFEKEDVRETLGEVLSKLGLQQIRIAETEKYPHVTFFFSGGREEEFRGERRILIPSPKVATYDLKPEMSAFEVTQAIIEEVDKNDPDFICLNYANADMVGHTGVFQAAVKAVEAVDQCLSKLIPLLLTHHYQILVIADHGNSDYMINQDGSPNTAHTKNPVPCIFVSDNENQKPIYSGKLADVAPTILTMMNLQIPSEMEGKVLFKE